MKSNNSALYTLISVFFFWGFVAASNDILIPVFKQELHLKQWQSQMISFAFYVAYTVGSVLYVLISASFSSCFVFISVSIASFYLVKEYISSSF